MEGLELALLLVVGIQALAGIDDDVVPPLPDLFTSPAEMGLHLVQTADALGELGHVLDALAHHLAPLLVAALLVRLVDLVQLRLQLQLEVAQLRVQALHIVVVADQRLQHLVQAVLVRIGQLIGAAGQHV